MEVIIKKWLEISDGYGSGDGSGDGYGYSYGSGYGFGSGYGYKLNGDYINKIDGVNTIIKSIKGQVAKGYIVNNDLTWTKTFIVKDVDSKHYAHGKTIKDAFASLEEKIIADLDVDERINMFLQDIDTTKKYQLKYFFDWHGKLTGSCLQGRESFIKNKGLKLEDKIDFNEFMELCDGQYGWEVIKQLEG